MPEPPLPKKKKKTEQSRLPRVPDHEGGERQGGRELHLGERRKAHPKEEREGKQEPP